MAKIISILGQSGSGKTTQCQLLVKQNPRQRHFTMSSLLKAELNNNRLTAAEKHTLVDCMENGLLIDEKLTWKIAKFSLDCLGETELVMIDGFPRSIDGLLLIESPHTLAGIIYFDISTEKANERRRGQQDRTDTSKQAMMNRDKFLLTMQKVVEYADLNDILFTVNADDDINIVQSHFRKSIEKITNT